MSKEKLVITLLCINVFLLSASSTLVLPFLPLYLQELNTDNSALNFYTALAYSSTYAVSIVISPLWGHFADKYGKKLMLTFVFILLALSYLFAYLSTNAIQLCLSRAFQGLACGIIPAFLSLVSCIAKEQKAGIYMGYMQSGILLGTLTGPMLGGVISQFLGVKECFFIIIFVSLFILLTDIIFIKEPNQDQECKCKQSLQANDRQFEGFIKLIKDPIMRSLCMCVFIHSMVIMLIVPVLANVVENMSKNDFSVALSGVIFSLSGFAGALISPFWGKFGTVNGFLKVLCIGSFGAAVSDLIQSFNYHLLTFAIMQFVFGLFICTISPSANSITAKHVEKTYHARAYSLIFSSQQSGNLLGPIVASTLLTFLGERTPFLCAAGLLFILSIYLYIINVIRHAK